MNLNVTTDEKLPGENGSGASGSGVHLVKNHVLQFLVIHRSKVDISLQRFSEGKAGVRNCVHIRLTHTLHKHIKSIIFCNKIVDKQSMR